MKYTLSLLCCVLILGFFATTVEAQCNCSLSTSSCGGSGHDTLEGDSASNCIDGNGGDDTLKGKAGTDWLYGEDGDDTLCGGSGDDYLYGGNGDDNLTGESGSDYLNGGSGADTEIQNGSCSGGGGNGNNEDECTAAYSCAAINAGLHGNICPQECVITSNSACGFCGPGPGPMPCLCTE